jgi:hypothetical protein
MYPKMSFKYLENYLKRDFTPKLRPLTLVGNKKLIKYKEDKYCAI